MTVYEKLQQVQSRLNVPKNQVNKFGGYNYRSCEDIMEAVKPVLKEAGAALVVGDELVMIGDRYYVKACATFIDAETGECVTNIAYAREAEDKKGMDVSQITGSASSYARKYAMNGLFCLDDVKDADTMDNTAKSRKKADDKPSNDDKPAKLEGKYLASLNDEIKRTHTSKKSILTNYDVADLSDLTFDQYQDAMSILTKKPDYDEYVAAGSDLPWN